MSVSFLPGIIVDSVTCLTPEYLISRNIRLLMLDFDNTIVPYTTDIPTAPMAAWLEQMRFSDVRICVVSNSRNDRVRIFCKKHNIDCITRAKKPGTKGIKQCIKQFGFETNQCAIAGDQIFTDTLGGNFAGVLTILVRPICNHNFWLKARHVLEKPFIYAAKKRRVDL